jgi:hypothetical protein
LKKLFALLAAGLMGLTTVPSAGAGPSAGGITSDNVEWIAYVPFDFGTASGASIIGKYMYVTSWRNFSIYDVSDPLAPALTATVPFGFKMENEDVDSNGEIMIFSETNFVAGGETQPNALHVWNVEDKSNPVEMATLDGAGQHTLSCLDDCKWLYGSDGFIIDLRDPSNPKKLDNMWTDGLTISSPHDVNEVGPGRVLTSSDPMVLLDTTNPAKPKAIAFSELNNEFIHSSKWPRGGKDRFALSTGETWLPGADIRCDQTSGAFTTWNTTGWQKGKAMSKVDVYRPPSGTVTDGYTPTGTTFGCSTHWFEHHPSFKNGGIVGVTFFNQGTHFLRVDDKGKVSDEGWFIPHAGNAAALEWASNRVAYSIDLQRGFDVLQYNGKF